MTHMRLDPIVAIATASGRGAIGVVRISGNGLEPMIQAVCGTTLKPRQATLLTFRAKDGSAIDQGLALYFPAPHSYTGEGILELQGHGGPVVMRLLLARCLEAAGEIDPETARPRLPHLRLAEPGEFTQRAFLNNKIDLAQAEAIADLIDASTEAAARSASRSLVGAFSNEIDGLRAQLIELRMLVEATMDFPEEEIDFLEQSDAAGRLAHLQRALSGVLQHAHQGALLREGIKIVIAGQPNAGKSSLLNALAGAELAIVTPIPGTTRDKIQETIQIEGVPLHVVDTAGLRDGGDEVERLGIERAWAEIGQADAVLFVHDLTRCEEADYRRADEEIRDRLAKEMATTVPVLDVWNKSDQAMDSSHPGIRLSARTGAGLGELRQGLLQLAGWQGGSEGTYIARQRHLQALRRVEEHLGEAANLLAQGSAGLELVAEELRQAQNALGQITGEFSTEDLLGVIFSSFCIGK